MERLEALGRISDEPGRLTRLFGGPAMRRANDLVQSWMRQAGMETRTDALGNLIGHLPGPDDDSKILLLGSHLDTVPNAGKYDGPLGIVLAIACIEELRLREKSLPFAIDVIAFADEEGTRFQSSYLGSRALIGRLFDDELALLDANGVTLEAAIRNFGGDPRRLKSCPFDPEKLLGYIEVHIEQGPVLEQKKQAVGVVTAIAGQAKGTIWFEGWPGHAGTTPMDSRHDALCAAAEFILQVEKYARDHLGLVATVGRINAQPNTSNVIPGSCEVVLDLRHQENAIRQAALEELMKVAGEIGAKRGLKLAGGACHNTNAVACSADLLALLRKAARRHQADVLDMVSGAGHDAVIMAKITPVAMLFVRCKGGVSHHPDESVRPDDVRVALNILTDFVHELAGLYHS